MANSESYHIPPERIRFGAGGILLQDLFLVELRQVSRSSFQPIFAIRKCPHAGIAEDSLALPEGEGAL
jgi:hypothetical protein